MPVNLKGLLDACTEQDGCVQMSRLTFDKLSEAALANNAGGLWYRRWFKGQKAITNLEADVARLREALEPFDKSLGGIAENAVDTWPDNETIEHSGAAEEITWGDLRRARQALKGTANEAG